MSEPPKKPSGKGKQPQPPKAPKPPDPEKVRAQELKRSRIFHIAQLMVSGEWRSHMAKSLGTQWGLETKTVQHYSAEASRLCDFATGQREALVKIARLRLLEVLQQDEPDRVPAMRTMLEHLGELRTNNVAQPIDPFEGWTEQEKEHYATTGEIPERFRSGPKS